MTATIGTPAGKNLGELVRIAIRILTKHSFTANNSHSNPQRVPKRNGARLEQLKQSKAKIRNLSQSMGEGFEYLNEVILLEKLGNSQGIYYGLEF